jgi:hypothetical protein
MKLHNAIRNLQAIQRRLPKELEKAERANLKTVKGSMRHWSSGKDKSRPRKRLLPINKVSGVFRDSFATEGPELTGDTMNSAIWNEAPHAVFLDKGTRYMAARPLPEKVISETEDLVSLRREEAILRSLR